MFEKIPQINNQPKNEEEIRNDYEKIFAKVVCEKLIEDFEEDLYEIFDYDQADNFLEEVNGLDVEDQKKVFSLPKSIRIRRLKFLKEKFYKNNNFNLKGLIAELIESAEKNGFALGYHISPNKILEKEDEWVVNGTEMDDRDDRKMAYYSLDYENLFRKKRGNFLYIVRAIIGKETSHKKDTSNNWGRADQLSIVAEVPLEEVDNEVNRLFDNLSEKKAA
jgi:hypothetical protein